MTEKRVSTEIQISEAMSIVISGEELDIGNANKSIIGLGFNINPEKLKIDFNDLD